MKHLCLLLLISLYSLAVLSQIRVNRYSEAKVSAKGIFGKSDLAKEVNIPSINVKNILDKWDKESRPRFAEPVAVDIFPLAQGQWERAGNYQINRIKVTAKDAYSIVIYFDKLQLSQNAELYIYNASGTVVAGPITSNENIRGDKLWASNVFSGNAIILEFKVPDNEVNANLIHIQKILYGIAPKANKSPKDSLMGPGFGLSSSCNVNINCISGWSQEQQGVAQVIDERGGWCSAFLVMNTCNTTRPYVMTANHCIVHNELTFGKFRNFPKVSH